MNPKFTLQDLLNTLGLTPNNVFTELLELELEHVGEQHRSDIKRLFTFPDQDGVLKLCKIRNVDVALATKYRDLVADNLTNEILVYAGLLKT